MAFLLFGSDLTEGVYHLGRQADYRFPVLVENAVGKLQQDRTEGIGHVEPSKEETK